MEFRILGPLEVVVDGCPVSLGAPKQRALLALLLIYRPEVLSTDRIIDELWGEQPPRGGVKTLRVHISKLREVLEPERAKRSPAMVLVTEGRGYALKVDPQQVDATRFESLCGDARAALRSDPHHAAELFRDALGLWRGEPLADFRYQQFAQTEIVRLNELRLAAVEDRIDADIAAGGATAAVAELEAFIDQHPLREGFRALHMTALYRTGRQTEALRSYQQLRAQLGQVGIEPSPELRELEQRILDHDPALAPIPRVECGTLPAEVDRFVGRVTELEELADLLDRVRLVTLVGAGGSGKTRLALQAARHRSSQTPVWFVDLARVTVPTAVPEAVLDALGLAQHFLTDPLAAAVRALANRAALVIIDNCEHLVDSASETIERLLGDCAGLVVLATSREPLRIRGETVMAVPPLQLPDGDDVDAIVASDAGQLLIERARAVDPDFGVDRDNAASVAALLGHVDGIPLAIELAAVHLQSTPPDTLAGSLGDVIADLGVGRRTAQARHRTLTAALDWSYRLLEPSEQDLFRVLGVLLTDFDEDAVMALGGSLADLGGLVSKSMVTRIGAARYRLLVPVRQYAIALLEDAGDAAAAETARNDHFAALAAEMAGGSLPHEELQLRQRFAVDRVHLGAALDALHHTDPERSARLAAGIALFWLNVARHSEGLRIAERALVDTGDTALQCELHLIIGWMKMSSCAYAEAEVHATAASDLATALGDDASVARALRLHGSLLAGRGQLRLASERLRAAAALYETHRLAEWSTPLLDLGFCEAEGGNVARASAIVERLRQAGEAGDMPAFIDLLAGTTARIAGDLAEADRLLAQAADGFFEAGSPPQYRTEANLEQALVRFERGDVDSAEELVQMALSESDPHIEDSPVNWIVVRRLLGRLALERGDLVTTRSMLKDAFHRALDIEDAAAVVSIADITARLAAALGDTDTAAKVLARTDERRHTLGVARDSFDHERAAELRGDLPPPRNGLGTIPELTDLVAQFLG